MRIIFVITTILIFATGCSSSDETDMVEDSNNETGPLVDQNEDKPGLQSDGTDANEPGANDPDANIPDANDPDANDPNMVSATINSTNYEQVLRDVIGVLNLEDIDTFRNDANLAEQAFLKIDTQARAGEPTPAGLEFLSEENILVRAETGTTTVKRQYACLSGGGYSFYGVDYRGAPVYERDVSFDNCKFMDAEYSGDYGKSGGRRSALKDTFKNFVMKKDGQTGSITGVRNSIYQWVYNAEDLNWNDVTFSLANDSGSTTVTGMNWQRTALDSVEMDAERYTVVDSSGQEQLINAVTYKSDLSTNFQLSSVATAQATVSVAANLEFRQDHFDWVVNYSNTPSKPAYPVSDLGSPLTIVRPDETRTFDNLPRNLQSQWQSGLISVVAEDGSQVNLQPSAGDATKVLIELNASGEQMERSWSDGFTVFCSKLIAGCGDEAI